MIKTLGELVEEITTLRPELSRTPIRVELTLDDGSRRQGVITDIRVPKGCSSVVIFAEE